MCANVFFTEIYTLKSYSYHFQFIFKYINMFSKWNHNCVCENLTPRHMSNKASWFIHVWQRAVQKCQLRFLTDYIKSKTMFEVQTLQNGRTHTYNRIHTGIFNRQKFTSRDIQGEKLIHSRYICSVNKTCHGNQRKLPMFSFSRVGDLLVANKMPTFLKAN